MLHAFILEARHLHLAVGNSNPTIPLRFSANPSKGDGKPLGLVAVNGNVHTQPPEGLPVLVVYKDGGCEIRRQYGVQHISDARFIVSGSALLLEDGRIVDFESPLNIRPDKPLKRMALGVRRDGSILMVTQTCTVADLALCMLTLKCEDAIMTSYGDVFLDCPMGGVKLGTTMPVTVLEAVKFKELPRPIVVIDAGHGGEDPGASGFGLREKDLNLKGAKIVHQYFLENYEGTFLMVRVDDSTVDLMDRPKLANAVKADFYLSLHINADSVPGRGHGYESFVHHNASTTSKEIQKVLHKYVMDYLKPFGIHDRGMKTANFAVLRETKMPAVLVENLFIDHPDNNKLLRDETFLKELYTRTAEGFAMGVGLKKRVSREITETEDVLYKVQVGAFRFRKGAEDLLARVKNAGFSDAYITSEKTKKTL